MDQKCFRVICALYGRTHSISDYFYKDVCSSLSNGFEQKYYASNHRLESDSSLYYIWQFFLRNSKPSNDHFEALVRMASHLLKLDTVEGTESHQVGFYYRRKQMGSQRQSSALGLTALFTAVSHCPVGYLLPC